MAFSGNVFSVSEDELFDSGRPDVPLTPNKSGRSVPPAVTMEERKQDVQFENCSLGYGLQVRWWTAVLLYLSVVFDGLSFVLVPWLRVMHT